MVTGDWAECVCVRERERREGDREWCKGMAKGGNCIHERERKRDREAWVIISLGILTVSSVGGGGGGRAGDLCLLAP